jgi:hypothetical protein
MRTVVYTNPTGIKLNSLNEVRTYLLAANTCKCGLDCPLDINEAFNFDPNLPNCNSSLVDLSNNNLKQCCHHLTSNKRRSIQSASLNSSMNELSSGSSNENYESNSKLKVKRFKKVSANGNNLSNFSGFNCLKNEQLIESLNKIESLNFEHSSPTNQKQDQMIIENSTSSLFNNLNFNEEIGLEFIQREQQQGLWNNSFTDSNKFFSIEDKSNFAHFFLCKQLVSKYFNYVFYLFEILICLLMNTSEILCKMNS